MKILRKKTAKEKEVSFEVDFERRRISGRLSLLFGDQIACVAGVERGRGRGKGEFSLPIPFRTPATQASDQIVKQGDDRKYVMPPKQTLVLWASSRVHNVSGGARKMVYGEAPPRGSTPKILFYIPFLTETFPLLYTIY